MGVYVCLEIQPEGIDPERWATVYMQTLQLLKAWPSKLWRLEIEHFSKTERFSFLEDIEAKDFKGRSYWSVCGDFSSMQHGEDFRLYEDLSYYQSEEQEQHPDILFPVIEGRDSHTATVFDEKTQGHEYHHAMICVAMWIEHCFPLNAFMTGDVDLGQCERAAKHIMELLGEEVKLPLCVNSGALLVRLSQLELTQNRFDAFMEIFCGNESESLTELLHTCDEEEVDSWLMDCFKQYESLRQMGSMEWFIASLNAGKKLEELIEMLCFNEDGPQFEALDFAVTTAAAWLAVPRDKRDLLEVFRRPTGESETVYSQLGNIFFDMGGLKGRHTKAYMDKGDVLDVFERLFGKLDNFDDIVELFERRHAAVLKRLEQMRDPLDQIMEKVHDSESISDGTEFFQLKDIETSPDIFKRWFEYLARHVKSWREKASNQEALETHLKEGSRELLFQCVIASERNGLNLSRKAWDWIESQVDEDLLITILALMDDTRMSPRFVNARWAVLEKPDFIEFVHETMEHVLPFQDAQDAANYPK